MPRTVNTDGATSHRLSCVVKLFSVARTLMCRDELGCSRGFCFPNGFQLFSPQTSIRGDLAQFPEDPLKVVNARACMLPMQSSNVPHVLVV